MGRHDRKRIVVLTVWCLVLTFFVIAEAIALVIMGLKVYEEKDGMPIAVKFEQAGALSLGESDFPELVEENYIKYLNKAYILIGSYPDCEMYKISANIPRNDFDFENDFVFDENDGFQYRVVNGEKVSRVAIDVSQYQDTIDWKKVKDAGVTTAIVRIGFRGYGSSGSLNLDPMFADHYDKAAKAGLEVMPYFFSEAVSYEEGVEEANFTLKSLKGHAKTDTIVVDTEYIYSEDNVRANDISAEDRTEALKGFCETIKAAGYKPIIYASFGWFIFNMDLEQLSEYELWLAAYDGLDFPYKLAGWQYTPSGSCPGVEGDVDVSVWFRDK
ncbi:Lyzozyme M1 (1,4-beta-N-acetylmuramidase), GH25 family [Eubacterium ruminantium]|nr:Lyzozyme M1 (1,4-beta-N-acetylmuramidase), GH25 family [Eubacterium ruminantium]